MKMDTNAEAWEFLNATATATDDNPSVSAASDGEIGENSKESCSGAMQPEADGKSPNSGSLKKTIEEKASRNERRSWDSDRSSTTSSSDTSGGNGGDGSNKNGNHHHRTSERSGKDRRRSRSKRSEQEKRESWKNDRKRHKRRSSSLSSSKKSRSRSRSRTMTRTRRSRYRRDRSEHDSSRTRTSKFRDDLSDDNQWGREHQSQYDSYKYQEPNRTIMVRGLAPHLSEIDVKQEVLKCGIMIKDIRLVRNHTTGESRGFAFVEFYSIADSVQWMNIKQGLLIFHDKFHASVIYSIPKVSKIMIDWTCEQCQSCNFKRREFCYKCNHPRPEEVASYWCDDETSTQPTTKIILSNLDILTTEESILQSLQSTPHTKSLPIKSVKIQREPGSSMSKGKCYVETNNISDAYILFSIFSQENFKLDGRTVSVAYGKYIDRFGLSKNSTVAAAALAAAQWTNNVITPTFSTTAGPPCTHVTTKDDVEKMAQYYAQLYAKTQEEYITFLDYYRKYYEQEVAKNSTTLKKPAESKSNRPVQRQSPNGRPSDDYNNMINSVGGSQTTFGWSEKQNIGTKQIIPDTKSYQYDGTSGFYFDPISGLYYDAKTQYYYDSEKQEFLYWNPHEKNYIAVPGNNDGNTFNIVNGSVTNHKVRDGVKQEKTEVAKQITKKMEKWAKALNQRKDAMKQVQVESSGEASSSSVYIETASSISSSSIAYKNSSLYDQEHDENISTFQPISNVANEISLKNESVYKDDVNFNSISKKSVSVDENKLTCLLCKRKFPNKDVLQKHVTKSDLHKKNLEALQRGLDENMSESSAPVNTTTTLSYRDRAKERRERLGSTDLNINKSKLKDLYLRAKTELNPPNYEEPATSNGIKDDNVGNRMLQKMGWLEGQGLGRDNQGQVDIIKVALRSERYGLGIRVPEMTDEKLDSRAEARKITLARYQELD